MRPAPRALPSDAAQLLDALLTRRRQLLEMPVAEKNRLGFAPRPLRGKRMVWGGRAGVRTALYLAALRGRHWHPQLRRFYERLLAAGKPKKVALIACARKLLTILNAMVRNSTRWMAPTIDLQHSC